MQWLSDIMDDMLRSKLPPVRTAKSLAIQDWLKARIDSEIAGTPTMDADLPISEEARETVQSVWHEAVINNSHKALAAMSIKTLTVIQSAALESVEYQVLQIMMSAAIEDEELIRSTAVMFKPMNDQKLASNLYDNAFSILRASHPLFDVTDLSQIPADKMDQARAVMKVIAYNLSDLGYLTSKPARDILAGNRADIPEGVIAILMDDPDVAPRVIDFLMKRGVAIQDIDPELLKVALSTSSSAVDEGVL